MLGCISCKAELDPSKLHCYSAAISVGASFGVQHAVLKHRFDRLEDIGLTGIQLRTAHYIFSVMVEQIVSWWNNNNVHISETVESLLTLADKAEHGYAEYDLPSGHSPSWC